MQEVEVEGTVSETLEKLKGEVTSERLLEIIYRPQSLFRVRPVTRCTSSIPGKFATPTFFVLVKLINFVDQIFTICQFLYFAEILLTIRFLIITFIYPSFILRTHRGCH